MTLRPSTPLARARLGAADRRWRLGVAVAALTLACSGDAPVVAPPATAGPDTLSVERLSSWIVLGQPLPVTADVAEGLATHWGEMTALASLEPGRLRDPKFVESVIWPRVRGSVVDSVLARDTPPADPPSPEEVESLFQEGRLRLLARVLRRASPQAHPEERQRQRDEAFRIRKALTEGASWNEAVARSEDEATQDRGGLLGVVGPGELERGLERAAYQLEPGAISAVVETREGFQILFRPRLEEVRELFEEGLAVRQGLVRRAALVDSLVALRSPVVEDDAAARLLDLARGRTDAPADGSPLARWEGGVLADTTAARYLTTLPPADRRRLVDGPEADARDLVLEVARQEILWRALSSTNDPEVQGWEARASAAAQADWVAALEPLGEALGLDGPSDADARQRRVTAYMEAVVSRRREPVTLPPVAVGLATETSPLRIDTGGLRAAVERAQRLLVSAEGPG